MIGYLFIITINTLQDRCVVEEFAKAPGFLQPYEVETTASTSFSRISTSSFKCSGGFLLNILHAHDVCPTTVPLLAAYQECKDPLTLVSQIPSSHSIELIHNAYTATQNIRRYATEGPSVGSSNTLLYSGVAAAGAGAGGYYYYSGSSSAVMSERSRENAVSSSEPQTIEPTGPRSKTFTGGDQGWIDLKLKSIEVVNHNTKKLRFALNSDDDVSGLQIACLCHSLTTGK